MRFRLLFIIILALFCHNSLLAQQRDSLRYPISDRRADALSEKSKNPFDLRDTSLIKKTIEYDPATKQYVIVEKIGNRYYRTPTTLTFEEFWRLQGREQEREYFKKRSDALTLLNKKVQRPPLSVYNSLFDRIFGLNDVVNRYGRDMKDAIDDVKNAANELAAQNRLKIDIRPTGDVNILAGYQGQNIKNPTLPERARKNGGFDFDMNANLNVNANIGNKLKFPINYNTLSNLNFDNQIKLDYKGMDDELIKSIEAGNISFQSRGTLIPSAQNLFGIKTQLQFGKLFVTGALANQRSSRQSVALQGGAATQNF